MSACLGRRVVDAVAGHSDDLAGGLIGPHELELLVRTHTREDVGLQEQFRRRLGEVGEIASFDHGRLRAKTDRARNAAGRHGVVASDHDHPDSSPLACAYRIRNVASRRVLQPGQTQERQGLERRTIRHRSCERRERKDPSALHVVA